MQGAMWGPHNAPSSTHRLTAPVYPLVHWEHCRLLPELKSQVTVPPTRSHLWPAGSALAQVEHCRG